MELNQPSTFGFTYTLKCTASCGHCCFSCTPFREEKMDFDIAMSIIRAAKGTFLNTVFFSGGEVFLYYDELLELMREAKSDFSIIVATNGFWGSNYDRAKNMLKQLKNAGLTRLIISYDEFHAQYTPPQSIINIIKICKSQRTSVEIQGMAYRSGWRLAQSADLLLKDITEVPVSEAALLPVGAAAQNIPEDQLLYEFDDVSDRCMGSNAITIFPNGDIYTCCSPVFAYVSALKIGTIKDGSSFLDLIQSTSANQMMGNLRKYGIVGTCSRLWPEVAKKICLKDRYVNTCDKCYHVLNQVEKLRSI
jgi:hypothetical protein